MLKKLFRKKNKVGLGLNLKPGDNHYRAFVGPPRDYDFVSAMVFNLLTCIGLRQNHRVLDIGCGSLRNGRLLIPYLNKGNYIGIEPNKWLVDDGIRYEVGHDLIKIKNPLFSYQDSLANFKRSLDIDFAFAQSIFSHTGIDLLENWLSDVSLHLKEDGVLLATFFMGAEETKETGWIYPDCIKYSPDTIEQIASKYGLRFQQISWFHPRQTWVAFYKSGYNTQLIESKNISWQNYTKQF